MFEKVADDALGKYENDLTAKGWSKTDEASLGIANTLMMQNSDYGITLIYDPDSKGISITVSPRSSSSS